jgi:hypothetical protein
MQCFPDWQLPGFPGCLASSSPVPRAASFPFPLAGGSRVSLAGSLSGSLSRTGFPFVRDGVKAQVSIQIFSMSFNILTYTTMISGLNELKYD